MNPRNSITLFWLIVKSVRANPDDNRVLISQRSFSIFLTSGIPMGHCNCKRRKSLPRRFLSCLLNLSNQSLTGSRPDFD